MQKSSVEVEPVPGSVPVVEYFVCLPFVTNATECSYPIRCQTVSISLKYAAESSSVNYLACQKHSVCQHIYRIMFLRAASLCSLGVINSIFICSGP